MMKVAPTLYPLQRMQAMNKSFISFGFFFRLLFLQMNKNYKNKNSKRHVMHLNISKN